MREGTLGLVLQTCACSGRGEVEDGEVEAENGVNKEQRGKVGACVGKEHTRVEPENEPFLSQNLVLITWLHSILDKD